MDQLWAVHERHSHGLAVALEREVDVLSASSQSLIDEIAQVGGKSGHLVPASGQPG